MRKLIKPMVVLCISLLLVVSLLIIAKTLTPKLPQPVASPSTTPSKTKLITIALESNKSIARPKDEIEVKVKMLTTDINLGAARLVLSYDTKMLELTGQNQGRYWSKGTIISSSLNQQRGTVDFIVGENTDTGYDPEQPLAIFRFKIIADQPNTLSVSLGKESEFASSQPKSENLDFKSADLKIPVELE